VSAAGALTSQIDAASARHAPRRGRERFLIVRLAGKEFALQASRICGIMQMRGLPVQAIQGPKGWNHSVHLHGRRLPVYSHNSAAGVPDRLISARTCLLLIDLDADPGQPFFAFQADSVSRFEELPLASIRGNCADGRRVRLCEKWRPVIDLNVIAADFYAWRRDRSATTI